MQSCWHEAPKNRPTFQQLVYSLAKILGEDVSDEYFFVEGPQLEEDTDEQYDSIIIGNQACMHTTSSTPEYEVPVSAKSKTPSVSACSSVPDPEVLRTLSGAPPEYDVVSNGPIMKAKLGESKNGGLPDSSPPPIYHTLEQPVSSPPPIYYTLEKPVAM